MWCTLPSSVAVLIFTQELFYKMKFVHVPVLGWFQLQPNTHPVTCSFPPSHSRMGEKMGRRGARKLMGQDKDRKIT